MVGLGLAAAGPAAAEDFDVHMTGQAGKTSIEAHAEIESGAESRRFDFGAYLPIIDADGRFQWKRLLEPAYASVGIEKEGTAERDLEVVIPALWAQYFDTAEWQDPTTREQILAAVSGQVRDALMQDLHGLNWDEKDYADREGLALKGWNVTDALVVGEASPEAGRPSSVKPGNVEEENVKLAEEVRGVEGAAVLVEALQSLGIKVDESLVRVEGDEIQFTPDEYQELQDMAAAAGKKGNAAEAVWKLIADYNRDKIADPALQADLDRLVGDKRMVRINLKLERGEKDTYLIPLPLLALGLLALRRRKGGPKPERPIGPPREPILDAAPANELSRDPAEFGNEVGVDIERSLDFYLPIMEAHEGSPNPDDNEMAHMILDAWTKNDNELRRRAGLPEEAHHRTRPRQVLYANLHARALRRLAEEADKRKLDERDAWKQEEVRRAVTEEVEKEIKRLRALQEAKG